MTDQTVHQRQAAGPIPSADLPPGIQRRPDGTMITGEARRAAIRAQLNALTRYELREFVDRLARRDVASVELPLAGFLAARAQQREQDGQRSLAVQYGPESGRPGDSGPEPHD